VASKVDLEYKFFILTGTQTTKPGVIAKRANEIAGEFFGELKYELSVEVRGDIQRKQYTIECIARATIEAT
jgi:hypothetical protein